MKFNTLSFKITVPVITVLTILVTIIVVYVFISVQQFSYERTQERLQGAYHSAVAYVHSVEEYNAMQARIISGDTYVINFVQNWERGVYLSHNRPLLLFHLEQLKEELGIYSVQISDANGNVIMNTHDPEVYDHYGIHFPDVNPYRHYGEVGIAYYPLSVTPMAKTMGAASPIRDHRGNFIGTAVATLALDSDFADYLSYVFNAEVTFFYEYTSVASTIRLADGGRAVGTQAAEVVRQAVLDEGRHFSLEINLFGVPHQAYYVPLRNWESEPVGIFFVGFSTEEIAYETNVIIRRLIGICMTWLVVAAIVMRKIIKQSVDKVTRLTAVVDGMIEGSQTDDLSDFKISNDEVGTLANDILILCGRIKRLSAIVDDMAAGKRDFDDDADLHSLSSIIDIEGLKEFVQKIELRKEEANAANKAKSEFLSAMSHEIRTPMNAILGIAEIQLQNPTLDPDVKDSIEKIFVSGDMLMGIINDILDFSKIEAGKMELLEDKYEIASLISDTSQLNIMRIGSKSIHFEVNVSPETPAYMMGDELRIKQILNNILSNAFKYTEQGTVTLKVFAEEQTAERATLVMSVTDTGQGMTKEQLGNLFKEYQRFNLKENRSVQGTGLGLNITYRLVNMMNGRIEVESEPGKGTTFTVYLPQEKGGPEVIGAATVESLGKFRTGARTQLKRVQVNTEPMPYGKVLIVDDVEINIFVAKGIMSPYELKMDSADSGFKAIEKVEAGNQYDIIFMDHMMPNMDGIETTKRLRDMGYNGPVVALTANAIVGQSNIFLENGFDDFISKPIDIRQLNVILKKLIRDRYPDEVVEEARVEWAQRMAEEAEAAAEGAAIAAGVAESSEQLDVAESEAIQPPMAAQPDEYDDDDDDADELGDENAFELDPEILEAVRLDFIENQANVISEIHSAIEADDKWHAQNLAHTLKGLAGLLSERKLSKRAQKVEYMMDKDYSEEDEEYVPFDERHIRALEAEHAKVMARLKK